MNLKRLNDFYMELFKNKYKYIDSLSNLEERDKIKKEYFQYTIKSFKYELKYVLRFFNSYNNLLITSIPMMVILGIMKKDDISRDIELFIKALESLHKRSSLRFTEKIRMDNEYNDLQYCLSISISYLKIERKRLTNRYEYNLNEDEKKILSNFWNELKERVEINNGIIAWCT